MVMRREKKIKAIAFDVGNVLLRLNYDRIVSSLARAGKADPEQLWQKMQDLFAGYDQGRSIYAEYEKGLLDSTEFIKRFNNATDLTLSPADFLTPWNDLFDENQDISKIVAALKGQLPLMLLSNTNEMHADNFTKKYEMMRHFDHHIFSHRVGAMKPDEKIYRAALAVLDLEPAELFFIEDREMNIKGAQAVGIKTFQYANNDEELISALREEGLNFPPEQPATSNEQQ